MGVTLDDDGSEIRLGRIGCALASGRTLPFGDVETGTKERPLRLDI